VPFLRDVPIRKKLIRIIMVATGVALFLVGVGVMAYEVVEYRSVMIRKLMGMADVIGANSTAALVSRDPKVGAETLGSLRVDPRIVSAVIYGKGEVFATYQRGNLVGSAAPATPKNDGAFLEGGDLVLFRRILHGGERIGTIYIRSELKEMYANLWQDVIVLAVVMSVSLSGAWYLSSKLQGAITEPILQLAGMARIVSDKQDYSIRAVKFGQDELGLLIDGFNEMLAQIQQRDLALQQAQEELEERVKMRTSQLQIEITERKRAEEALKKLSSAVEQSGDSVVITDREGFIEFVNPAFERQSGYSREEAIGRTPRLVKSGLHEPEFYRQLWQTILAGQVFRDVLINRRKDGTLYYEYKTIAPIRDSQGQITHFVSDGLDITERIHAEAALKESEEKYRTLIEVSQDAIFINHNNHIVYMNPAFVKLLGAEKPDQIMDKSPFDFIHPQDHELVRNRIKTLLDKGMPALLLEEKYVKFDGTVINVEVAATPLTYKDGRAIQVVVRDITERKRAEEQLRSSREQLRALAAHLESIREDERSLIAREIHDELGQMLTGLKIDLSWLAARLSSEQSALLKKVPDMEALIDATIQSVRRISSQLRPGVLDDLGLIAAIEWQAQEFQSRMGMVCRFTAPSEEIELDPDLSTALFRILQEALTNVIRHAHATHVTILLTEEADRLILTVTDNGRGITEQELAAKTSLGLLGIRERALLLGGEVAITGHPGAGTTVKVGMPLKRSA
jgi:PAS domain S-box-containing protein